MSEPRTVEAHLGDCVPPELKPIAPLRIGPAAPIDPIKATIDGALMLLTMVCVTMFIAGLLTLALSLAAATRGHGHEWFPVECCAGNAETGDCKPLNASRVHAFGDGSYSVDGRFYVPASEVRASLDGRFYGCLPRPDRLRCFFAPPRGM